MTQDTGHLCLTQPPSLISFCFLKKKKKKFYIPPHESGRVLSFHIGLPCVSLFIRPFVVHPVVGISFPDDNLSKQQWIFIKLGMCIDIVEIWFGIANEQISSGLEKLSAQDMPILFIFGP